MLQTEALEIMKTGSNIFLTGVPGAGKTYVVNQYIAWLEDKGIYPAVTASTGIAATHIGGRTIHSFVGIGVVDYLNDYVIDKILENEKLYKKIFSTQVLIIDEISMLDAKVLDKVDTILKAVKKSDKAFGGVQMIFVGDFFQLPPVTKKGEESKYFAFQSRSWREAKPLVLYLQEQYRQTDETLTKLLLAIRENNIDEMHVEILEELKEKTAKKFNIKLAVPQLNIEQEEPEINYETPTPDPSPLERGASASNLTEGLKINIYNSKLIDVARENRKKSTESEKEFWSLVKDQNIGYEFVRQKPIGNFVVDFYCKELNLVVEIDGGYHLDEKEKARDKERENILLNLGIRTLRFSNVEVFTLTEEILKQKVQNFIALSPFSNGEGPGMGVLEGVIQLHSHNKNVDEINSQKLAQIKSEEFVYKMETHGRASLVESLIRNCLSPEFLKLKKGAKVIFTKNDIEGKYVNGTMGIVVELDQFGVAVETNKGKIIEVKKDEWAIEEDGKVKARILQYPLRLAWAITVHKSQGMSLDEAIINLGQTFEYGQGYVALSRVKSLDGLYLVDYNPKALRVNEAISEFDEKIRKDSNFIQAKFEKADREKLEDTQRKFVEKAGGVWEGGVERQSKAEKKSTQEITLEMINQNKNISEIAKERDMSEKTIQQHLIDLYLNMKIEKTFLAKVVKENFGFDIFDIPNEVKKSFKKNAYQKDEEGRIKLSPIFKDLKEKYSFEQLKFWRVFIGLN